MKNLNLFFNKLYYKDINLAFRNADDFNASLEKNNEEIFNASFDPAKDYKPSPIKNTSTFLMKVLYPGLLIGTGYSHGTGLSNEDINCGFSFDYVTGQPYIPGSSVKGLLRSCFKHNGIVSELLPKISCSAEKALESSIFGEKDEEDGVDVFLDAVIRKGDKKNKLICSETLAPHKGITEEPDVLQLLKISPDVVIEFRFVLKDSVITDGNTEITISAQEKTELFNKLLEIFGIGSKTNVGYGAFESVTEEQLERELSASPAAASENTAHSGIARKPLNNAPVIGEIYSARVIGMDENFAYLEFHGSYTFSDPKKQARVHKSKISNAFCNNISDFLSVNDEIYVMYIKNPATGNCEFSKAAAEKR